MRALSRAVRLAPIAVVAVALGRTVDAKVAAAIFVAAALVLALPRALDLPRSRERWITLGALVAGGALGWLVGESSVGPVNALSAALATAALAAAAARAAFARPEHGEAATFALTLTALAACGHRRQGPAYGAEIALVVAGGLGAMWAADPARVRWRSLAARQRGAVIALVALASLAGGAIVRTLPPLQAATERILVRILTGGERRTRAGFHERVVLSDAEVESSHDTVLRLRGPHVDYLRGAVLDNLDEAGAAPLRSRRSPAEVGRGAPAGRRVEVRAASPVARYFVPLGAGLATPSGLAQRVESGGWLPDERETVGTYWIDLDAAAWPEPAPSIDDVFVPSSLRRHTEPLARQWTAGRTTDRARLAAIVERFAKDFRYTLHRPRSVNSAPLLDFLLFQRAGHCEYFASAMAALARSIGIPARVVTGFRVGEENELGGWEVVRADNAHAWVEAWVDGAWQTFDPTPAAEVPQNLRHRASWARAFGDWVAGRWDEVWLAAGARARLALAALIVATGLGYLLRHRFRRVAGGPRSGVDDEAPMPELGALLAALAARGLAREPWEPLERLADRVDAAGAGACAATLRAYAAHRWGGRGDAAEVARGLQAALAALDARAPGLAATGTDDG